MNYSWKQGLFAGALNGVYSLLIGGDAPSTFGIYGLPGLILEGVVSNGIYQLATLPATFAALIRAEVYENKELATWQEAAIVGIVSGGGAQLVTSKVLGSDMQSGLVSEVVQGSVVNVGAYMAERYIENQK